MNKSTRLFTFTGLIVVGILFVAINMFSNVALTNSRLDLTSHQMYTLSPGTMQILQNLKDPITLQVYYSKKLATGYANVSSYAQRVQEMLQEFARHSNGKLIIQQVDPEPYSELEDKALAYELTPIPVDDSGKNFYFGLVGNSAVDTEATIPFFDLDREAFLEYDLAKVVYRLAHPEPPTVGVITNLPIEGNPPSVFVLGQATQPWAIWKHLQDLFTVEKIGLDATEIPENMRLLVLIQPQDLSESMQYAIDQFVLRGGRVLAFADPYAETGAQAAGKSLDGFNKLLANWGVQFDPNQIVLDRGSAKQVWFTQNEHNQLVNYAPWYDITPDRLAKTDVVTANIGTLTMASTGTLQASKGATTTFHPLMKTTADVMLVNADRMDELRENPESMLRGFTPIGSAQTVGARINGPAKSAFTQAPKDQTAKHIASADNIEVIVVADLDFLNERFWQQSQNQSGQNVVVPTASNGDFFSNSIDNLTGSTELISVRSRGEYSHPFTRVEHITKEAEKKYRLTEQKLTARLEELETRLSELNDHVVQGDALVLSPEQRQEIDAFSREKLEIRKQLRMVQHNLQKDIDLLSTELKLINIGLMPLLIGIMGVFITGRRLHGQRKLKRVKSRSNGVA